MSTSRDHHVRGSEWVNVFSVLRGASQLAGICASYYYMLASCVTAL